MKRRKNLTNPPVVVPWLRRDQWYRFCEVFAGEDPLPSSYDEWLEDNQVAASGTCMNGAKVRRVEIDVEGLVAWCKAQNRVVDPLSMMLFASAVAYSHDHPDTRSRPGQSPRLPPKFVAKTIQLGAFGPKVTFYTVDESAGESPAEEPPVTVH